MALFDPTHASLKYADLQNSVVVLTGGASGIGRATILKLHALGARVIFGDLDEVGAQATIAATDSNTVHFLRTNVCLYQDNLALFKFALNKYGRVDHAIANAGVTEQRGWFDPRLGIEGVESEPVSSSIVLDVNLKGVVYFANIACAYLAHGNHGVRRDKTLLLLSSIAGWKESPGVFVYQASKHGVLGLLRTLRLYVPQAYPGVRVNAICPSFTNTRMVNGIRDGWIDAGLPVNDAADVATVIVGATAAGPGSKAIVYDDLEAPGVRSRESAGQMDWEDKSGRGLIGRALHVMGGKACDIEEGLDRTESLWLGSTMSAWVKNGQQSLGDGSRWVTDK